MSSDAIFGEHISKVVISANLKCSWILRLLIFHEKTHEKSALLTLWKSMVIPILDYCSQLWSPNTPGLIQTVEKVQLSYLKKILGMRSLDYWEQLKFLKLYSLQRRRERYMCIYMWKILEGLAPSFGVDVVNNHRTGRYCKVPHVSSAAPGRVRNIRFNSMGINGPRIFNCLPSNLRGMSNCSVGSFKRALDRHLAEIPDEPRVLGPIKFCLRGGNSLLDY